MNEATCTGSALLLALALTVGGCAGVPAPRRLDRGVEDPRAVALATLREKSEQPPRIHLDRGIPRFVSVRVPAPPGAPDDPVQRALDFLEKYRDFYGIEDPRAQLYLERNASTPTGQHVFFGQRRDKIPVFGAQLAVHLDQDAVVATNGNYLSETPHLPPPTVDEQRAEANALNDLGANAERIGQLKLVYFNRRLFMSATELSSSDLDGETHLAWRLTVVASRDGQAYSYFIDAQSGAVLFRLDLSPSHAGNRPVDIRSARNSGPTHFCGYTNGTAWFDTNGVVAGAMPDSEGTNVFGFAQQIHDFFQSVTPHRHSWDGNDFPIGVYLDDGTERFARFKHACKHAVFGDNMATLDIMAHEITHGLTSTSAGGGLISANQSGALNESYSDVFAAMIDDANWTIGEGMPPQVGILPGGTQPEVLRFCALPRPAGTFRDLSDPPACNADPDSMSLFVTTTVDNGGIHTNCGIPNKAAFLIAAGGTHNGIAVRGIGRGQTTQLYYEVLTAWLGKNSSFTDARNLTVLVAQTRFGAASAQACAAVNAFAAVGLGLPDLDCDGMDDSADPDDDGDTIGDSADNCPAASNPGQGDSDVDGVGDACELDADNDTVPNASDNCPLQANPGQADKDSDKIGDLCDDSDVDGVLDSVDNCANRQNPAQTDFDSDGIGDACDRDGDDDGVCEVGGSTLSADVGVPAGGCPLASDNCPRSANKAQSDIDQDGYGDACDQCPSDANSGNDEDGDGLDSACDSDDDNDGKPDASDNCPTVSNPDQRDINGNGIGQACDPGEGLNLGSPGDLRGALQFRREALDRFQIAIRPGGCAGRDCFPSDVVAEIRVWLEMDLPVRVVDDQGFVVAEAGRGLEKVLRFRPEPEFFYWPPAAGPSGHDAPPEAMNRYQGRQYFLEVFPTPELHRDRSFNIRMEATSGIQR